MNPGPSLPVHPRCAARMGAIGLLNRTQSILPSSCHTASQRIVNGFRYAIAILKATLVASGLPVATGHRSCAHHLARAEQHRNLRHRRAFPVPHADHLTVS